MVDISILLLVHDDAKFLARTFRALEEATAFASLTGTTTELVIGLDRATAEARDFAAAYDFGALGAERVVRTSGDSPESTRAASVRAAAGEFLLVLGGRDIVSFNALARFVEVARSAAAGTIVVPQFVLTIAARCSLLELHGSDVISTLAFASEDPFPSPFLVRRDRLSCDAEAGDGRVAADASDVIADVFAGGAKVVVATEAIVFTRDVSSGVGRRSLQRSSRLFGPDVFRSRTRSAYERRIRTGRGVADPALLALDPVRRFLTSDVILELVAAAAALDPGINFNLFPSMRGRSNVASDDRVGARYHEVAEIVPHRDFGDVFVLPYLTMGGADRYVIDVMHEAVGRTRKPVLVACGQPFAKHSWIEKLPPGSVFLDLVAACPDLSEEERHDLLAMIVRGCAAGTRVHLKQSPFSDAFYDRCSVGLADYPSYFYRFCDGVVHYRGFTFEAGSGSEFISTHLETLAGVISDHEHNVADDRDRFQLFPEKWHTLPSKVVASGPVRESTNRTELRVLWASRFDRQKRPDLLCAIARALESHRDVSIAIDVFGVALLDTFDVASFARHPNIVFRGGFPSIAATHPETYDLFLYTSSHDGIPIVLLETAAAGLPSVAPALGGIPEFVLDDETGRLIDPRGSDDEVVARYVDVLVELARDRGRIDRYSAAARRRLIERHGEAAFSDGFDAIFSRRRP